MPRKRIFHICHSFGYFGNFLLFFGNFSGKNGNFAIGREPRFQPKEGVVKKFFSSQSSLLHPLQMPLQFKIDWIHIREAMVNLKFKSQIFVPQMSFFRPFFYVFWVFCTVFLYKLVYRFREKRASRGVKVFSLKRNFKAPGEGNPPWGIPLPGLITLKIFLLVVRT